MGHADPELKIGLLERMYDWAVGIDPYANIGLDESEIPVDETATDI